MIAWPNSVMSGCQPAGTRTYPFHRAEHSGDVLASARVSDADSGDVMDEINNSPRVDSGRRDRFADPSRSGGAVFEAEESLRKGRDLYSPLRCCRLDASTLFQNRHRDLDGVINRGRLRVGGVRFTHGVLADGSGASIR